MKPALQLDRKFDALRQLGGLLDRPAHGWVRALREALGMTSGQLARRMGVKQPRVVELEQAEKARKITLQSLDRAAEAMGCRVVYVLVPDKSLCSTLQARAQRIAAEKIDAVDQTMRLEEQDVAEHLAELREELVASLLQKPARLWDDP